MISEHNKNIGNIEVAYSEAGQGQPVILIHGLAEDHYSFANVQSDLQEFNTFAYDFRGHGKSSIGNADGTLEQLGNDLANFIEAIEKIKDPVTCVGYSLGGTIVLWLAAMRPELVKHAIVVGTSTKVGYAACEFFKQRIALFADDQAAFSQALHADTAAQIVNKTIDVEAVSQKRLLAIGNGDGYINAAKAMIRLHDEPLTTILEQINCHVDVIAADQDVFCPRKATDIILSGLKDVEYHEIANAGHLISVDQPQSYADILRKALKGKT